MLVITRNKQTTKDSGIEGVNESSEFLRRADFV